ncbi:hypothetical protein ACFX13_019440 [Malus domestica]
MSIEALAMAGADYMECGINFEEWERNDGVQDPPSHLLADEQSFEVDHEVLKIKRVVLICFEFTIESFLNRLKLCSNIFRHSNALLRNV